jgi:hypothetical protein
VVFGYLSRNLAMFHVWAFSGTRALSLYALIHLLRERLVSPSAALRKAHLNSLGEGTKLEMYLPWSCPFGQSGQAHGVWKVPEWWISQQLLMSRVSFSIIIDLQYVTTQNL